MKNKTAELRCTACGVNGEFKINHLSRPIDVFYEWSEKVNKKESTENDADDTRAEMNRYDEDEEQEEYGHSSDAE